jgi:hypothetical protein
LDSSAENVYGSSSEFKGEGDENHSSDTQRSTPGGVTIVKQREAEAKLDVHGAPCDSRDIDARKISIQSQDHIYMRGQMGLGGLTAQTPS